ncbi:hypothetical protein [Rhizobium sp. SYY.PMSO]|uniref:hypothetical protein n=1 Tax=Rhizobium sp. SYY.PMSO TaxID=3382192 RepID=UPI00398FA3B4
MAEVAKSAEGRLLLSGMSKIGGIMLLNGPERYALTYTPQSFTVLCNEGTSKLSGLAVSKNPKLYIASVDGHPTYVGITRQKMQARLRYGWSAACTHG